MFLVARREHNECSPRDSLGLITTEEVVTHSLDIGSSQWQTSLTTSQRRQIRDGNVAFTLWVVMYT